MMKKRWFSLIIGVTSCILLAGCGRAGEPLNSDNTESVQVNTPAPNLSQDEEMVEARTETKDEDESEPETEAKNVDESESKSLAARMTGKYRYLTTAETGDEELLLMNVVNFGDNLYAFCGLALPEDSESFGAYSFWATEFIPYDANEIESTEGNKVKVNAMNFSIMSNAGLYWDAGHTGTITLTDEGLVFEGFDHDGFLVPDSEDSRLFIKDERVEDIFPYLKSDDAVGEEELQGYWVQGEEGSEFYIRFCGSNMYMYKKTPGKEVLFIAGGCDFHDGSFDFTGSELSGGGVPFEFSADYKLDGDYLTFEIQGGDAPDMLLSSEGYKRITGSDIHVTTMD